MVDEGGWQATPEALCYAGEEIEEHVTTREGAISVTSHRVLVFTPDGEGSNFQAIERPNVTGISKSAGGATRFLLTSAKWLLVGLVLAVAGWLLDFEGVLGPVSVGESAGQVGVDWIGGLFSFFTTAFALLDDLLLVGGVGALVVGLALLGWYWHTRAETIRIEVAGEEAVELPGAGVSDAAVQTLDRALEPPGAVDSNPSNR
ncbi:hypothetical protein HTSR_2062 [Halodesulfurarchaeum formicicum]|uniref:Uncharacterized protein n=1 Tax=Halodesulfurarchaeum formicicum TaxID=1873524 RepID=A0A1D8S780_9EURY|nr:hypothetical protein [Halodesulfurarchaeum formicicum]AOW81222.1 hypothetical protein HTSR_2062 [Halodesulfurarchaeum formicicum]